MLSATQKEHQGMTMRTWYKMTAQSKNNVTVLQPLANIKFWHVSNLF